MSRIFVPFFVFVFLGAGVSTKEYRVYLLAGQSNMEGFGYVDELPEGYARFAPPPFIYHGNIEDDNTELGGAGVWDVLKPGHGTGFKSDGKSNTLSNRFGPELGIAKVLCSEETDTGVAFIKYAKGGTALDGASTRNGGKWNFDFKNHAGINQYDHCLATIRSALAKRDIDGDGEIDRLVPAGIFWMQGESDGHELEPAYRYEENLEQLVALFRAALGDADLPVVIGRISDSGQDPSGLVWQFGNVIRAQQEAYCAKDPNAALVRSTDAYFYSDKWHYDTAGFIDLGEEFGRAMLELND